MLTLHNNERFAGTCSYYRQKKYLTDKYNTLKKKKDWLGRQESAK